MSIKKRVKRMIKSKHMLSSIGIASFLESTLIPIPLETILLPLMQARRDKLFLIASVTTMGCVIGSVFGYALGYFLFDLIRDWVMQHLTNEAQFADFKGNINSNGFLFVFSTGVTPIPLQIAMLVAGVTGYSFGLYVLAVSLSRCIRYFGLAWLVYVFGNQSEVLFRRYKWQVAGVLFVVILSIISMKIIT